MGLSRQDVIAACEAQGSRLSTVGGFGGALTLEHPCSLHSVELVGACEIGGYSYIGKGSELRILTIGRFCSVARRCAIGLAEHPTDMLSTHPFVFNKSPMFRNDAYLEGLSPRKRIDGALGGGAWKLAMTSGSGMGPSSRAASRSAPAR